jgi:CBS domain-containing protein
MLVRDVLSAKGTEVVTIRPSATVTEIVGALAEHRIGALVVIDEAGAVVGIVSERDVARGVHSHAAGVLERSAADIMTSEVRTCRPEEPVRELAKAMTDGRFRHAPVVVDGALSGIVSIGDIVKSRIDELETEQDQLVGYLSTAQ